MYAIADIKGFQYKVEKGDTLKVPLQDVEVGKKVKISEVLLVSDNDKVSVGTPFVEGAVVEATVKSHDKDKKVVVFKKKRRKD
ncbi:50S ribosomal protein L21, partial [Candidatus Latescibacterota bacterium]